MPLTPLSTWNAFDWTLVVILLVSSLMAFLKGFIKVFFSLFGVGVGIVVASWNYRDLALPLHRWISSLAVAQVLSFLLIVLVIMLVFTLIASFIRRAVSAVGLGFFDRLLGAAFGLLRGFLLGVAALMAISAFLPDLSWVRDSQLAPYFLRGAHAVSFVVPNHFAQEINFGAMHVLQEERESAKPSARSHHVR